MSKFRRAILHGLLFGILVFVNVHLAWGFMIPFIIYEVLEEWRIADHSYNDMLGVLIGVGVIAIGCIIKRLVG